MYLKGHTQLTATPTTVPHPQANDFNHQEMGMIYYHAKIEVSSFKNDWVIDIIVLLTHVLQRPHPLEYHTPRKIFYHQDMWLIDYQAKIYVSCFKNDWVLGILVLLIHVLKGHTPLTPTSPTVSHPHANDFNHQEMRLIYYHAKIEVSSLKNDWV